MENSGYEIPLLLWQNPTGALAPKGQKTALESRPYQTDYLDNTMLALLKVSSAYYQPEHDLLSPQFRPAPRLISGKPYQPEGFPCPKAPCQVVH